MPTINLAEAEKVIAGSKAKIFEMGVKMSVSVTDARGDLIAMIKTDGASWRTPTISRGKAIASATFGAPSVDLEERSRTPVFQAFTVMQEVAPGAGYGQLIVRKIASEVTERPVC